MKISTERFQSQILEKKDFNEATALQQHWIRWNQQQAVIETNSNYYLLFKN